MAIAKPVVINALASNPKAKHICPKPHVAIPIVTAAPKPDPAVRILASMPNAISRRNNATTGSERLSTIAAMMVISRNINNNGS
ncbi:hypothetical protein D3C80_977780 [compost metagenome]